MTPALTGTGTDLDHDAPIALRSMRAIGTTAAVAVTDADCADDALALLAEDLRALDDTCSRFRPDSELRWLEEVSEGRAVVVSPLLFDVVEVACVVAVQTAGIVDPTVGSALIELGYDRDFDDLAGDGMASGFAPTPAPGWWQVRLDRDDHTLAIPTGVHLDVGATAKALAADRSAGRLSSSLGCGALVNLGGDVAVAGTTPTGGWAVGIAPRCTTPLDSVDQVVTVHAGGLATSGTTARTWVRRRSRRTPHHRPLDRRTGTAGVVPGLDDRPELRGGERVEHRRGGLGRRCGGGAHRRRCAGEARGHHRWDHLRRWLAAGHHLPPRPSRRRRAPDGAVMLATSSPTLWYATRATGIVSLVLLTLALVFGILTAGRAKSRSWPAIAQADLHKRVSILAMVFLSIHVLTAVLDTYVHLGWASIVVPFSSSYEPLWTGLGAVALDLMLAVAVSSALRQRISARTWRGIHWLAYGSWPLAMAHALGEGTDGFKLWMDVLAGLCTVAVGAALGWRIVEHRVSRERARRAGARTRAVPERPGLLPATRRGTPAGSRSGRQPSATDLLAKERP